MKIRKLLNRIFWKRKLCPFCANLTAVSNHSPCYSCKKGSNWVKEEEVIKLKEVAK